MGKYSAAFTSLGGVQYTVEIAASWLTNKTLVLDADPVHLVVAEAKTKLPGLRTTECEIKVLSTDPMTELYSESIMAVTVLVKHGSVVDFVGFLETSEWNMPCAPGMLEAKQLVAVDALSAYLQKPCYERSFRSMISVMDELKAELNTKLPVTVSYDSIMLRESQIYGAYVNIDSLQPENLYADQNADEDWTSWGEIVNEFAKGTASTVMMVSDKIKAYYVDTETSVWCTQAEPLESRLTNTSMTIKMVPSVRRVENHVNTLPNLNNAEVTNWEGRYITGVMPMPVFANIFKPAMYFYPTGLAKFWRKGPNWPYILEGADAVCGLNYAEDWKDIDREVGSWMVGINAESWPVHVLPEYSPSQLISVIDIEAQIHIESYNDVSGEGATEWEFITDYGLQAYPRLWHATREESITPANSTIALKLGSKIINPYYVTLLDELDQEKKETMYWLRYKYSFNVNSADLKACDFKPTIIVRSPDYRTKTGDTRIGYRWARSFKLIGDGFGPDWEEGKTVSKVASGAETGTVLSLDCKFNQEYMYAGEIRKTAADLRDPLTILAAQYAQPRQQWQATASDAGFDPTAKVWCRGVLCTQTASDRNLRDSEVTVTVLS